MPSEPPSEPDKKELIKATAAYLTGYIGDVVEVSQIVDPDPHTDIRGLDELLKYHFIRTGQFDASRPIDRADIDVSTRDTAGMTDPHGTPLGVLDFLSVLPARMRSIDPAVTQDVQVFDNEIRGRIDWNRTIKHRYTTGDTASQTYACRVQNRTVLSPRNRTLLELLTTIQSIYQRFDDERSEDDVWPRWLEGWGPNGEYRAVLEGELENPHFRGIDLEDISVTPRELTEIKADREPLYREAAALLSNYRRLDKGEFNQEYAESLLSMDVFHPDEDNAEGSEVYELYWIFELLNTFDEQVLEPIQGEAGGSPRGELIAKWQANGSEYLLFNDWEGKYRPDEDSDPLDWIDISVPEYETNRETPRDQGADHQILREGFVKRYTRHIFEEKFSKGFDRKTPDIVLLKLDATADEPTLQSLFIGEVKHSTVDSTLNKAVPQILEYGGYAKLGEDLTIDRGTDTIYVASDPDLFKTPEIELGLFVGAAGLVEDGSIPGIQVRGFGDDADRPFGE